MNKAVIPVIIILIVILGFNLPAAISAEPFLLKIPSAPTLANVRDVAVDSSGNIYATSGNNVIKFSADGTVLLEFGSLGTGDSQFNNPQGIAVDGSGNIYVVDFGNNRIQIFNSAGVFQSKFGSFGTGDGQFDGPQGIALDISGNMYVADIGNDRIQIFNSAGVFLSKFGSNGSGDSQFNNLQNIALDSSGNIYVADTWNDRIQKFGTLISCSVPSWGNMIITTNCTLTSSATPSANVIVQTDQQ